MDGINSELRPFVRMTCPGEHASMSAATVEPGRVVFKSWLLLFTVLPFDRHVLVLDRVDDGHGFVEESSSWLNRRWRHERRLVDTVGGGCVLTDSLVVEPRIASVRPLVSFLVGFVFRHRHRRLTAMFAAR